MATDAQPEAAAERHESPILRSAGHARLVIQREQRRRAGGADPRVIHLIFSEHVPISELSRRNGRPGLIELSEGDITLQNSPLDERLAEAVCRAGAGRIINLPNVRELKADIAEKLMEGDTEIRLMNENLKLTDETKEAIYKSIPMRQLMREAKGGSRELLTKCVNWVEEVFRFSEGNREDLALYMATQLAGDTTDARWLSKQALADVAKERSDRARNRAREAAKGFERERLQYVRMELRQKMDAMLRQMASLVGEEPEGRDYEEDIEALRQQAHELRGRLSVVRGARKRIDKSMRRRIEESKLEKGEISGVRGLVRRMLLEAGALVAPKDSAKVAKLVEKIAKLEEELEPVRTRRRQLEHNLDEFYKEVDAAIERDKSDDTFTLTFQMTDGMKAKWGVNSNTLYELSKIVEKEEKLNALLQEATRTILKEEGEAA